MTLEIRPGGFYSVCWLMEGHGQNYLAMVHRLDGGPFRLVYRFRYAGSEQRSNWYTVEAPSLDDCEESRLVDFTDRVVRTMEAMGYLITGSRTVRLEIRGDHEKALAALSPYLTLLGAELLS